jgi:hypothetical protein
MEALRQQVEALQQHVEDGNLATQQKVADGNLELRQKVEAEIRAVQALQQRVERLTGMRSPAPLPAVDPPVLGPQPKPTGN